MRVELRKRLVKLLCESTAKSEICDKETFNDCRSARGDCGFCTITADYLLANDIIVPPCRIGETLHLIQIDHKGDYNLSSCEVSSKITMLSILRAYEEKTIVYMSTDKNKVEKKLKELKDDINGK